MGADCLNNALTLICNIVKILLLFYISDSLLKTLCSNPLGRDVVQCSGEVLILQSATITQYEPVNTQITAYTSPHSVLGHSPVLEWLYKAVTRGSRQSVGCLIRAVLELESGVVRSGRDHNFVCY